MHAFTARKPPRAAGLAAVAGSALTAAAALTALTALTACGSSSASGASAVSTSPLAAVRLAAQTSNGATSFTGTMSLRAAATAAGTGSGNTALSATFAEQLKPSLLAEVDVQTLSAAGRSLPGGMTEILTPSTLYMKWSYLTTQLHLGKPWVTIPLSSVSKSSGINLSQLFGQASSSSPLTESQLLGGATAVRTVGGATVGGVPVTEYTGQLSLTKGIRYLSGSNRSALRKELATAGISTATFTVWIDGSHTVRKSVITEHGTSVSETITTTITSINQPVHVSAPAASETASLPGGDL